MRACKANDCERSVFGGGYCKSHQYLRTDLKPLKKSNKPIKKVSERGKVRKEEKKKTSFDLHMWFLDIFDERAKFDDKGKFVRCFETGTKMYEWVYKLNLCIYSHYFPKSKYPQYAKEGWNLELVLPDIHAQWEVDPTKCPKMYEKYQKLKENDKCY